MDKERLFEIIGLERLKSYPEIKAGVFENLICERLSKYGLVSRQVTVQNRGDGRRGRLDIVFLYKGNEYAIEIDRKTPRKKSIFKISGYNSNPSFVILREPFNIKQFIFI